jgi:hypothetical protein
MSGTSHARRESTTAECQSIGDGSINSLTIEWVRAGYNR